MSFAATQTWRAPASQTLQLTVATENVTTLNDNHFFHVRLAYNVPNNFLEGEEFSFDTMEMPGSKGGNLIGFSSNGRFMVKEANQEDHDSLIHCCEPLCKRVLEGESFIAPTLAHFTRVKDGKHFFAALTCVPIKHDFPSYMRYDLKGNMDDKTEFWDGEEVESVHNRCFNFAKCWYGCDTQCCQCLQTAERKKYVDGKRHAFSCAFNVTAKQRTMILESLERDVACFSDCGTMDYSLLVTIIKTTEEEIADRGGLPGSYLPNQPIVCVDPDGGGITAYYMGVIDYLQEWTLGKKIAHLVKCCCAPHPISTVPPLAYRHQFFDHFDVKFRPEAGQYTGISNARHEEAAEAGATQLVHDRLMIETKTSEKSVNVNAVAAAAASAVSDHDASPVGAGKKHDAQKTATSPLLGDAKLAESQIVEDSVNVNSTAASAAAVSAVSDSSFGKNGGKKNDRREGETHEEMRARHKQESSARNAVRQKLMSEVDTHHEAMVAANEAAAKAHANQEFHKIKDFKAQATQHKENKKTALDKAMDEMFKFSNQNPDGTWIDLHGLQVAYAEEKTKEFLQTARENSLQKVEVITGAGNNSGKGGPKIKIAIQKMFNEMGLDFESSEGHHGSFVVHLKSSAS